MSISWGSARPCSALETSHFYIHFIFLHIGGKKGNNKKDHSSSFGGESCFSVVQGANTGKT